MYCWGGGGGLCHPNIYQYFLFREYIVKYRGGSNVNISRETAYVISEFYGLSELPTGSMAISIVPDIHKPDKKVPVWSFFKGTISYW